MNNISCQKFVHQKTQLTSFAFGIATLTLLSSSQNTWAVDLKKYEVKCGDVLCGTFEIDLDQYKTTTNTTGANSDKDKWLGGVEIQGKFTSKKNNEFHYMQSVKTNSDTFRWINDPSVKYPQPFLDVPPGGHKVRDAAGSATFFDQEFDYLPWYDEPTDNPPFPSFFDGPQDWMLPAKTIAGNKIEWLFETWIICLIDKKVIDNKTAKDDTYKVAPLWGFEWGYTIEYKDVGAIGTDEPGDFTVTKVPFMPLATPTADWNKATSSATKYGAGAKEDFWNITKGDCKECAKDFGDAPESYKTKLDASDPGNPLKGGPRYDEGELQRLGLLWDSEFDGQPTKFASGDDRSILGGFPAPVDDEDGVIFGDSWVEVMFNITRPPQNQYQLRAWWDLNRNGMFDHPTEMKINDLLGLTAGKTTKRYDNLGFDPRDFYSRFRLTWDPNGDVLPFGEVFSRDCPDPNNPIDCISHGEVEDYPPVPEPSSILGLFALGGLGLTQLRKKRQ
ncbi:MAG: PEP-CTERM sorting domain-containing protein [Crocosphaera sp.]